MAMSKGRAEFEALAQQNRDTFLKNRGSKSPFQNIDADLGVYYARIMRMPLGVVNMDKKGADGKSTGFKEKTMQAKFQMSVICSADPQTPPAQLERWKGSAGFVQYNLPVGDDEKTQRFYGDLEQIGIDTNGIVMTEADIEDPNNQYTLGQISDYLEQEKPCCLIAIVAGKDAGSKFINYRGHAKQEDIEQLIGHPLDSSYETVLDEDGVEAGAAETAYAEVGQAPFDATAEEGQGEAGGEESQEVAEPEWERVGELWHDKTNDKWFKDDGTEVEDPTKPKGPKGPSGPTGPKMAPKGPSGPKPAAPASSGSKQIETAVTKMAPARPKLGAKR